MNKFDPADFDPADFDPAAFKGNEEVMQAWIEGCTRIARELISKTDSAPDCMPDDKTEYPALPPAAVDEINNLASAIAGEVGAYIAENIPAMLQVYKLSEMKHEASAGAVETCMFIWVRELTMHFFSKKARRIAARAVSVYRDTLGASNNPGNHNQKKQ